MNKSLGYRIVTLVLGIIMIVFSIGRWTYELVAKDTINISVVYPAVFFCGLMAILLFFRKDVWDDFKS